MDSETQKSGKLIIILLSGGAGAGETFLSLTNRSISHSDKPFVATLREGANVVTFCSKQRLLQGHLTVGEHIQLVLTLYGHRENALVGQWLNQTRLKDRYNERTYNLTGTESRLLSIVLAVLPNPDLMFIDDPASGLSAPARQEVWRLLQNPAIGGQSVVIHTTRDLQIARALEADEVWLLEGEVVKYRWPGDHLPSFLSTSVAFVLEFDNQKSAAQFQQTLRDYPNRFGVFNCWQIRTTVPAIAVLVDTAGRLVDLMVSAGQSLVNFRAHPVQVDDLAMDWGRKALENSSPSKLLEAYLATRPEYKLTGRERRGAWTQIALSEWRRHFRGFWRAGNLVLSNVLPLGLLSSLLQNVSAMTTENFLLLAATTLMASAGLVVGWGTEAMNRLALTADTTRTALGKATNAPGPTQPFTPLVLFDISPTGRGGLLAGLLLGQWLILSCHACLFLLLWSLAFSHSPLLTIGLLFWLLVALAGLALATLLGRLARTPAQCQAAGWLAYLVVLFTAIALKWVPGTWQMLTWLWPFAGFTAAFQGLLDPTASLTKTTISFVSALVGTICLWWTGVRFFHLRPSIWRATK